MSGSVVSIAVFESYTVIVEGTGHFDASTMATWFVGNMVGAQLDWVRYRMGDMRLRGDDTFNAFLQRLANYMLENAYAWPKSNFYQVNGHYVLDGVTMGSPVMLIEDDAANDAKVCVLPHHTENFLMRDFFGNDIAYHRKMSINNLNAMQAFGKENLPATIQNELKIGTNTAEHEYLLCIARMGDAIFQNLKEEHQIPIWHPWVKLWFCTSGVTASEKIPLNWSYYEQQSDGTRGALRENIIPTSAPGFWHKPFNGWHYHRLPHETYSRTPGWYSLPDVKGLNAAWRTIHEVAHQKARPATLALETLKNKLRLGPEGVTWLTNEEYDRRPIPYNDNANYPWAMDFIDRRSQSVGRHFFRDMARMIESYSRDHKQPPTAYQLQQMISETLVLIGPGITSYAGPALHGIDEQFMEIELNNPSGRIWRETQPPDEIFEGQGNTQAVFTGPLIQGLELAMLTKRITQPLMMAAPVFEMWPDSKKKVRAEVVVEEILEKGNFIQDGVVGAEEYEAGQEALDAERRQIAFLEKAGMAADIVPKLQGDSGKDSPLKALAAAG